MRTKTFNHSTSDFVRVRTLLNLADLLSGLRKDLLSIPLVSGCEINLLNEAAASLVTADLTLPAEFSGIENTYRGFQYRLCNSDANIQAFNSGEAILILEGDLDKFYETTKMRFERWKMRSLFVLPLALQHADGTSEICGTVTVFSQTDKLDIETLRKCEALADLYAPQIKIHWAYHLAVERSKMVNVMYAEIQQFIAYITKMNSLTAVDQVFSSIGAEFIERFHFDVVNILLADGNDLAMVHTSFSKPFAHLVPKWEPFRRSTKYSLSVRDGQSALLFLNNQRFIVQDTMKILHLPMSEKDKQALALLETPRTFMIVPIRLNNEAIGVMWLASLSEPLDLPETDLTLIDLLASFISTAIRNAQAHMMVAEQNSKIESLNDTLQSKLVLLDEIARKDRLTGLNNFGSFEEELKRRTSENARAGKESALSVILLDIDHFKLFNDTYGHPAGNCILQTVGQVILSAVRDMDFVARYGGEEFAVLLPQCDLAGAALIAERIRQKIEEKSVVIDGTTHRVTVSGGYAQFHPEESADSFISRADQALYDAKHKGRNRVEEAQS